MRIRSKSRVILLLAGAAAVLLFLPGLPWSSHLRHTLNRTVVKAEMKWARWRGHEPRLMSITGRLNAPGAQVQALDSRSGWATLADRDGRFVLPGVMWYPGASYNLVVSTDELTGRLIKIAAPDTFPESGAFNAGEWDADLGERIEIGPLMGISSISREDIDSANSDYYKDLFKELTADKESDVEKIGAINDFVASKHTHDETPWEPGSPRQVLERGSRYCGHLAGALQTLVAAGGYKTRAVNMSDGNDPPATHMVVEVNYGGGWHLYDPTYGVKFQNRDGQIASYKEVRLDTSLILEDLFQSVRRKIRHRVVEQIKGTYETGYHHFYEFENKP
jgi:hypothetical protein